LAGLFFKPSFDKNWFYCRTRRTRAKLVEKTKETVKLSFFQDAFLEDPHKLFNAGLDAKKTRAIDFREGDAVDESALKELIRAAVAHNVG